MRTALSSTENTSKDFERQHAESIIEPATLAPIPPLKVPKILLGAVIRKPPGIVEPWLRSLTLQITRSPVDLRFYFILDFPANDPNAEPVADLLQAFKRDHKHVTIMHSKPPAGDYGEGPATRQWTPQAWHRVGGLKNSILQHALDKAFDWVWLLDADVFCDRYTLQSLLDSSDGVRAPIVAGVYWTHWTKPQTKADVRAGPQVWLRHPYEGSGWGWSREAFRAALIERQRVRVWGLGACTLIANRAIAKGVNFAKEVELSPGPMADGEDRHFCWRADRLHLPLFADAWPDIWHCYHAHQASEISQWMERLEREHPNQASLGDSISAVIRNLEQPDLEPQFVRGRLAALQALPEIREALHELKVGDSKLVRAHFPTHWPLPPMRGQTRLLHVELLDIKPYTEPPTIADELFVGTHSGSWKDAAAHTADQVTAMVAEGSER